MAKHDPTTCHKEPCDDCADVPTTAVESALWHYDAGTDGRDRCYIRTQFGRETGGRGVAVARVVGYAEWGPTAFEKHGRLLAAAPQMAEALRKALRESGRDGDLCAHEWHEAAREALRAGGVGP